MNDNEVEPAWVGVPVALAIHDRQLAEHGGGAGLRQMDLLEAALARPQHKWHYERADLVGLAASYAFGIARNHPFIDGNKRTAWVVANLFLARNGLTVIAGELDAIETVETLEQGNLSEEDLADWFRQRVAAI